MSVLVIVDMQNWFLNQNYPNSRQKTLLISRIVRLVKVYKAKQLPIITLEYAGLEHDFDILNEHKEYRKCIWTHPRILKAIGNYKLAFYRRKWTDDGSKEVKDVIKTNHLQSYVNDGGYQLCGVNTDCCVGDTHLGLKNSVLISGACANVWDFDETTIQSLNSNDKYRYPSVKYTELVS